MANACFSSVRRPAPSGTQNSSRDSIRARTTDPRDTLSARWCRVDNQFFARSVLDGCWWRRQSLDPTELKVKNHSSLVSANATAIKCTYSSEESPAPVPDILDWVNRLECDWVPAILCRVESTWCALARRPLFRLSLHFRLLHSVAWPKQII